MLHRTTLRTTAALAALAALAACGGGDDTAADTDTDAAAAEPAAGGSNDSGSNDSASSDSVSNEEPTDVTIEIGDGDTVRDVLTDAMGEQGADVNAAISALSPESRFSAVAGQLEPEPRVEVDGTDIRLVFDGGSVSNATFDCLVGGAFVEPGETLTMVYPDGEQAC